MALTPASLPKTFLAPVARLVVLGEVAAAQCVVPDGTLALPGNVDGGR